MRELRHQDKFARRPFAAGSIYGVRAFKPNKFTGALHAVHAEYIWKPGENQSFCLNSMPWMSQAYHTPRLGCTCGFYAYYNGKNDYHSPPATISGVIEGYGDCVVGDYGFQAGKAKIVGLVFPKRRRGFEPNMLIIEPWFVGLWTSYTVWLAHARTDNHDGFWDWVLLCSSIFIALVNVVWLLVSCIVVIQQEKRLFPTFRADHKLHRKIAKQYPDAKIFRTDKEAVEYFDIKTVYPVQPPKGRFI